MGISCEFNFDTGRDSDILSGCPLSGVVEYVLDKTYTFKKVTVSLKVKEILFVDDTCYTCSDKEKTNYIDIDNILHEDDKGLTFAAGEYEAPFHFTLPRDLPETITIKKKQGAYCMDYKVFYYVRIKFEKLGLMKNSKSFMKEIKVVSNHISSSLLEHSITKEENKRIPTFLCKRVDTVTLKANISNNCILPGTRAELLFTVYNNSGLHIKNIEVKLIEVLRINVSGISEEICNILFSHNKTQSILRGDTENGKVAFDVPSDVSTIQHSNVLSRNYFVSITAVLPLCYKNVFLKIPVVVKSLSSGCCMNRDVPPSYWEAMNLRLET